MSTGNERVRVARVSSLNPDLQASLARKRQTLASVIVSNVNSNSRKPSGSAFSAGPSKRKKVIESDQEDDDDEFIDDEDLSEEEEKPKRRKPTKTKNSNLPFRPMTKPGVPTLTMKLGPQVVAVADGKKSHTLSESSDEDEWLSKPKFNAQNGNAKKMHTRVSDPKPKPKKRILVSDEDEESDGVEQDLKANFGKTKIQHGKSSGEESGGDNDDAFRDGTPSSDSDADERRRGRGPTEVELATLKFFNSAPPEELAITPRVSEKISQAILENRPFETHSDLENALAKLPRGKAALEAYAEHLENRGVLERILYDCRDHADAVARQFEKCVENKIQPKSLAPGYSLHDYQQIGVSWLIMMYRNGFNCILGDEMGLGKTIQIVSFLAWLKENSIEGPHLIVVPSSTVENWMSELGKWCPSLKLLTYYGSQDERKRLRHMAKKRKDKIDVILTTYNMISSKSDDKKFFKNFSLNYVIYDEGHMLKNCATERYRNLMKVRGQRKILLTGTPLQNNLIELISLMYFVMTKIFTRYCEDINQLLMHFKQVGPALEQSNSAMYQKDRIEQAKLILQPYILRRLKAQVLSLPSKFEEVIEVPMEDKQIENYENVLDSVKNAAGDASTASASLMRLRQAANHPLLTRIHYDDPKLSKIARTLCAREQFYEKKVPDYIAEDLSFMSDFQIHQICEKFTSTQKYLLDESLALESGKVRELDKRLPLIKEKGEKVLIFSQFTSVLDILEVYLKVRGYGYCRLDGSTPVMERQDLINRFSNNSDLFVFLLSTKAGGLGINLTVANNIIIHDIDFNPYNDKQAEDRCHRMGQKREVHVCRLISKNTVEMGILALAKRKLQLEKQVTDGIKGQVEDDDENTRDSASSGEEKLDSVALKSLLASAIQHKDTVEIDDD